MDYSYTERVRDFRSAFSVEKLLAVPEVLSRHFSPCGLAGKLNHDRYRYYGVRDFRSAFSVEKLLAVPEVLSRHFSHRLFYAVA